jgi:hypothetical protein
MTDQSVTALIASVAGANMLIQTQAVDLPLPLSAFLTIMGMASAAFVTWGVFKKATERHEAEIELLREGLTDIHTTLADVRERVARIEGKLEATSHR